jgi:membrane-associated phospholipid phosphatase
LNSTQTTGPNFSVSAFQHFNVFRNAVPKRALIAICIFSALFFLLALDVKFHGPVSRIDRPISEYFHATTLPDSTFIRIGTDLAVGLIPKFIFGLAVILMLISRWHYLPALWFTVVLGNYINSHMQKYFARPRPRFDDTYFLKHPGFPSGHTAAAALIFGFLIILAVAELQTKQLKIAAIALAATCILFVGFTRVALLVHHFTDVIGAYLWCAAWLIGCYYGNLIACRWSAPSLQKWASQPA